MSPSILVTVTYLCKNGYKDNPIMRISINDCVGWARLGLLTFDLTGLTISSGYGDGEEDEDVPGGWADKALTMP